MITKKAARPNESKLFKMITPADSQEATIMVYGVIGQEEEYENGIYEPGGPCADEFVNTLAYLEDYYPIIHIRINSPGGSIFDGAAMVSAIQSSEAEVHCWNDGLAASIAADIWMAGKFRHMAQNAMMMIHAAWAEGCGNAKKHRDLADILDKFTEASILGAAQSTGIDANTIRSKYYADYQDHWLNFTDAQADGLINGVDQQYDAPPVPDALMAMDFAHVMKYYRDQQQKPQSLIKKALDSFKKLFVPATPPIHNQNSQDMNFEEFKKSLGTELNLKDVQAHIASLQAPEETEAEKQMKALQVQVDSLKKEITEMGKQPGESKAAPAIPGNDVSTGDGDENTPAAKLAAFNKQVADASALGGEVRFTSPVQ